MQKQKSSRIEVGFRRGLLGVDSRAKKETCKRGEEEPEESALRNGTAVKHSVVFIDFLTTHGIEWAY